jgi:molybdopterin converting factor small subunit
MANPVNQEKYMDVKLQLFGVFRNYGDEVELSLPEKGTVKDLREALLEKLDSKNARHNISELIAHSRFATDEAILPESAEIDSLNLAILPPVSGG